jgi:hypothetical protein
LADFLNSSPLKSLGQMNRNLVESIYGQSSLKSAYFKQELPVAAMFVNGSGRNEQSLQRTFHRCFLPNFSSFGKAVSEEKIFLAMLVSDWPIFKNLLL